MTTGAVANSTEERRIVMPQPRCPACGHVHKIDSDANIGVARERGHLVMRCENSACGTVMSTPLGIEMFGGAIPFVTATGPARLANDEERAELGLPPS